ncbi:hypothetical protein BO71DRAFT_436025 [Aspergillus ellipticus CBS 707.79]|uniref:Uncharacterized protein n=1 Tax=Aspergillus ellipticus CBS 707.79 TaxID=1448320 RepID=A0A319D0Q7_9EURO|nr:hypothetical protein BO71DRAFT_436025 [Aspergillus ellipticus CBS 707.79]
MIEHHITSLGWVCALDGSLSLASPPGFTNRIQIEDPEESLVRRDQPSDDDRPVLLESPRRLVWERAVVGFGWQRTRPPVSAENPSGPAAPAPAFVQILISPSKESVSKATVHPSQSPYLQTGDRRVARKDATLCRWASGRQVASKENAREKGEHGRGKGLCVGYHCPAIGQSV